MGFASFNEDISKRADEDRQAGATILGPAGGIHPAYVVEEFKSDAFVNSKRRPQHDPGQELHDVCCEIHRYCERFEQRLAMGTETEAWRAIFDQATNLLRKWGSPTIGMKATLTDMAELNSAIEITQSVADCLNAIANSLIGLVADLARLKQFHPTVKLDDTEIAIENHASKLIGSWNEIRALPLLLDGLYDHPEINRIHIEELERECREEQGNRYRNC